MTKQNSRNSRRDVVSRRSLLQTSAVLLSASLIAKATAAFAQERLVGTGEVIVCSYGGSFTENLRKHVFAPFSKATGIRVVDVTADNAEPQIKAMHAAGRVDWDVAVVTPGWPAYWELQQAGAFVPIDYSLWDDEALNGVPESARLNNAVVAFQSGHLLVYDERAFPKGGPKNWTDFGISRNSRARGDSVSTLRVLIYSLRWSPMASRRRVSGDCLMISSSRR